jgi:hypothetical protein
VLSDLQKIVTEIYESLSTGSVCTERSSQSRHLLSRMLTFYHSYFVENNQQMGRVCLSDSTMLCQQLSPLVVPTSNPPDVNRFEDIINLLFLFNYSIMGHLLHLPFHVHDSKITDTMWDAWCHDRRQAIGILNHIGNRYTIHMENREVDFPTIAYSFLAHQIRCLVRNAKCSLSESLMKAIAVHFSELKCDLAELIAANHYFQRPTDSYGWYDKSTYMVSTSQKNPSGKFKISLF